MTERLNGEWDGQVEWCSIRCNVDAALDQRGEDLQYQWLSERMRLHIQVELRVELFLQVDSSQLRWFGHLVKIPPGHMFVWVLIQFEASLVL